MAVSRSRLCNWAGEGVGTPCERGQRDTDGLPWGHAAPVEGTVRVAFVTLSRPPPQNIGNATAASILTRNNSPPAHFGTVHEFTVCYMVHVILVPDCRMPAVLDSAGQKPDPLLIHVSRRTVQWTVGHIRKFAVPHRAQM